VAGWIDAALDGSDLESPQDELLARVNDVVAYTTWTEVSRCVTNGVARFADADPTVVGSMERLVQAINESIEWHS